MENNKIKVRLRLVIIKNNKLLATYTQNDDFYFYIGGKLEYGETIKQGWEREILEELGDDIKFEFKKILYIRDYIKPEEGEHSVELYILGTINKFRGVEGRPDPEFDGQKWPVWLDLANLPDNLYPQSLSKKLVKEYQAGFPHQGQYLGEII